MTLVSGVIRKRARSREMHARGVTVRQHVIRSSAVAVFSAMVLLVSAEPVSGMTGRDVMRSGSGALRAPLGQSAGNAALQSESDPEEASRMAAIVSVLNRQGDQGFQNLERVSAMPVPNETVNPEFVVDARVERAAAAFAAAEAVENAAAEAATTDAEAALSAQATAEAQSASDAAAAAALASAEEATAAATREAQAVAVAATREAQATAATATREAEAAAAAATARADALAAAAEAGNRQFSTRVSLLVTALIVIVGGVLGLRLWRNRKEPFVLKAIPVNVTANANV